MPRLRDGIHFGDADAGTVVADARSALGDVNVVSHAHADHLLRNPSGALVCSPATAALVEARTGTAVEFTEAVPGVELLLAGHVAGSRAALIEAGDRRVLYTGDVSTRDRRWLSGFDPVPADELVVETTYGHPDYRFPPQADLEGRIVDHIADASREPLFLFGYSLGRAQALQDLAERATNRRVVVHDAVHEMNEAIERATDRTFAAVPHGAVDELGAEDVFVAPSHLARRGWVADLADRLGATKLGFSGWALKDSFAYRGGYDETFILTDHCDFDELRDLVRAVDPDRVYTTHGFDEAFATHLETDLGYRARPLRRDQTALSEFARED